MKLGAEYLTFGEYGQKLSVITSEFEILPDVGKAILVSVNVIYVHQKLVLLYWHIVCLFYLPESTHQILTLTKYRIPVMWSCYLGISNTHNAVNKNALVHIHRKVMETLFMWGGRSFVIFLSLKNAHLLPPYLLDSDICSTQGKK